MNEYNRDSRSSYRQCHGQRTRMLYGDTVFRKNERSSALYGTVTGGYRDFFGAPNCIT